MIELSSNELREIINAIWAGRQRKEDLRPAEYELLAKLHRALVTADAPRA